LRWLGEDHPWSKNDGGIFARFDKKNENNAGSSEGGSLKMEKSRIIISGLWVAVMLTYLLGDVLRIFAGDFEAGRLNGMVAPQWMWFLIAVIMVVPMIMLVCILTVDYPVIRWLNISVTSAVIIFNVVGLPYKGMYDNFLIGVSFIFNALTIWYSWRWYE
jgi:hypothetical protein